jgi:hypothetical protein
MAIEVREVTEPAVLAAEVYDVLIDQVAIDGADLDDHRRLWRWLLAQVMGADFATPVAKA